MKKILALLLVAFSLGLNAMEKNGNQIQKNELSEEDKNILRHMHALPNELKEKIIHHIHEEHYIGALDSYVVPRILPEGPYWEKLRLQHSFAHENGQFTFNKIPFIPIHDQKKYDNALVEGASRVVGPNTLGTTFLLDTCEILKFPTKKSATIKQVKKIAMDKYKINSITIHPYKNKFINFYRDGITNYVVGSYLDNESLSMKQQFKIEFFQEIKSIQFMSENGENDYLLVISSKDIRKIDINSLNTQKVDEHNSKKILDISDFTDPGLFEGPLSVRKLYNYCPRKSIYDIQMCKKYPNLFLVVVEFSGLETRKSFICNVVSQNKAIKVIKAYDGIVGFMQPIDTFVNHFQRNSYCKLPSKLLSVTPKQELIQNVIVALDEQVKNINIRQYKYEDNQGNQLPQLE